MTTPDPGSPAADLAADPLRRKPAMDSGRVFAIAFAVCFVLNGLEGLVRGSLSLSVLGLLFAPLVAAGCLTLSVSCARDLRAGRWAHGVIGLLAMGLPLGFIGSGAIGRSIMFPGCDDPLPATGTEVSPGITVEAYTTEDGLTLRGLYARGRGPAPRPGVVFFHGNGDAAKWNHDTAARLAAQNLDVWVAEYRGYGGCEGSPSKPGLLADGRAALAALEAKTGRPATLLMGRSLGTGVASALAAEGHGKAVLLVSPYTSIRDVAETIVTPALAAFALRDDFDSVEALGGVKHPVTIFHGTQDRVVPYVFGEALAESLGGRAQLVTLKGVGHDEILRAARREIAEEAARLCKAAGAER